MKNKKYLYFYYKHAKTNRLPQPGLCKCFNGDNLFDLLKPKDPYGYWGEPNKLITTNEYTRGFNPLRQNIVLLMAAMAGEL